VAQSDEFVLGPPPRGVCERVSRRSWRSVEHSIGLSLPADYRDFAERFGTGCWSSFLWIFNPLSANKNLNLIEQSRVRLSALRQVIAGGSTCPFDLYPEPGGLFPWGCTDNGDVLHWLTRGSWPTVIQDPHATHFMTYDGPCVQFVHAVVTGKLRIPFFPEDFPEDDRPVFVPARPPRGATRRKGRSPRRAK
jgi:hypothetical protein